MLLREPAPEPTSAVRVGGQDVVAWRHLQQGTAEHATGPIEVGTDGGVEFVHEQLGAASEGRQLVSPFVSSKATSRLRSKAKSIGLVQ